MEKLGKERQERINILYKSRNAENILEEERILERIDALEEDLRMMKGDDPVISPDERKRWMQLFGYYWKIYTAYGKADPLNHDLSFRDWMGFRN